MRLPTLTTTTRRMSAGKWLPADDPVRAGKTSNAAANAAPCYSQASLVDAATGGGTRAAYAGGAFNTRIVKASRMPQLPEEHHKIVIRPRGGLNLSKVPPLLELQ
ncbi:hypothetical protein MTO96_018061 [Rhipicephalus appendiculatus]